MIAFIFLSDDIRYPVLQRIGDQNYYEGYFREHYTIRIDTLYEESEYEAVAVMLTSLHEGFQYYTYNI